MVRGCLRAVSGGGASAVNVSALREQRCGFNAGEHHSVVRGCLAQSVCFWRRLFGRRRACSLRAALASTLTSITRGGRLPSCSLRAAAVWPSMLLAALVAHWSFLYLSELIARLGSLLASGQRWYEACSVQGDKRWGCRWRRRRRTGCPSLRTLPPSRAPPWRLSTRPFLLLLVGSPRVVISSGSKAMCTFIRLLGSPTWLTLWVRLLGSPTWLTLWVHPLGWQHRISCSLPEFPAYLRLLLFGALAPCWNLLLIRARLSRLSALKLDAYWNSCLLTLVGAHWSLLLLCVCCPLELRARQTNCLSGLRDVHFRLLTMRCDLLV